MRPQNLLSVIILSASMPLLYTTAHGNTIVRMETSLGNIDVELFDQDAPGTVDNFLNYVRRGDYDNSFIHRSAVDAFGQPFVIQGGGYRYINNAYAAVPQDPPIVNEFDPNRSNLRGTIAMAKLPSGPDTATNQWFFNMKNNYANLDFQNGGFTVFGRVFGSNDDILTNNDGLSMRVVDAIAALPAYDARGSIDPLYDSAWYPLPLIGNILQNQPIDPLQNLVLIKSIREVNHLLRIVSHAGNDVAISVPLPATLANLVASDVPDRSSMPAGVEFSEGFFSFEVYGLASGASIMVAMELPEGYLPNTYYMYGATPDNASPHWYEFLYDGQTGAEFFGNNYVVLHFVDGQRGDTDLLANGRISDPGGPGIAPPSTTSSNGGGCVLSSNSQPATAHMEYWLLALTLSILTIFRTKIVT